MSPTLEDARDQLHARCDTIEEAYEFMLGFAAQGLAGDQGSHSQIREFLRRVDAALTDLTRFIGTVPQGQTPNAGGDLAPFAAFLTVIERDARSAQAAVQLVLAQPSISSQLVDNLNASIHLRALLTDLFLIDEALKTRLQGTGER